MPICYTSTYKNALIGIWKINETCRELLSALPAEIANSKRFTAIKTDVRKIEFLAVRALLQILCGEYKTISYRKTGKPYLADKSFQISISHTKGYAAVILHETKKAGIDIEGITDKAFRLQKRFLSEKEIIACGNFDKNIYAVLCWSAKETLYKTIGKEGVDFVKQLHLEPFLSGDEGFFLACESKTEKQNSFDVKYKIFEDFVLTYTLS